MDNITTDVEDKAHAIAVDPANPSQDTGHVVSTATIWTCPMHPQIQRDGPGPCPICGMALEPQTPSLEDTPNPAGTS
jgi:Cu+-exporting ATPase